MKNFWNLKLNNVSTLFFLLITISSSAQFSEPDVSLSKEEKYLYPINPGSPGSLAGNMGELRTTHFHSGIDVRTNNVTGYPVRASKSGYVSRVAMSPTGYGNVLYITHPDGNTTLYAHLDHFLGSLAEYVLQEQYKNKAFDIDLTLTPNQFTVKQGDTIAISGNTGSSGGPHVHFDIRDNNNHALNPLKFGFSEIVDKAAPQVSKIALVTLDANSRINDRFGRFEFYVLKGKGNDYSIKTPILASGNIGVEVLAVDKFEPNGKFYGGVNYIDLNVDDKPVFKQAIDRINVEETRGIYTLMNFKTLRTKGARFYKLYIDDGNVLPFYGQSPGPGKIHLDSLKDSSVTIALSDPFGNRSNVSFTLKPSAPVKETSLWPQNDQAFGYEVMENIMTITAKPCAPALTDRKAVIYRRDSTFIIEPDYYSMVGSCYLIDLRKYMPDSISLCGRTLRTYFKAMIPSGAEYKYYSDWINIQFPTGSLYDTLFLNTSYTVNNPNSEIFTIGDRTIPLNKNIIVDITPKNDYIKNEKLGVYRVAGKSSYVYLGGTWVNGRLSFQTRELGNFTILSDVTAPTIRAVSINSGTVRFKISDDLSGIASYEANINGKWLLMHYDKKTATIWSERLVKTEPLKGMLELVVTDYAGNKQTFNQNIP